MVLFQLDCPSDMFSEVLQNSKKDARNPCRYAETPNIGRIVKKCASALRFILFWRGPAEPIEPLPHMQRFVALGPGQFHHPNPDKAQPDGSTYQHPQKAVGLVIAGFPPECSQLTLQALNLTRAYPTQLPMRAPKKNQEQLQPNARLGHSDDKRGGGRLAFQMVKLGRPSPAEPHTQRQSNI